MRKQQGRKIKYADKYTQGYSNRDGYQFRRHYSGGGPDFKQRNTKTAVKVLVFLLVAVLLVGAGYFLMSLWMDYRASQPKQEPAPDSPSVSQTQPAPSNTQPQPAAINQMQAIYIDESSLDNGAKLDKVIADAKKRNANTVVFELKRSDGTLAYSSNLEDVKNKTKAVRNPAGDVSGSLQKLKASGLTPMARLYCFQDSTAPRADVTMGILYSDGKQAWLDASASRGGKQWLNPYADSARAYLCAIIKEVADMGVEQIMLDGVQYPTVSLTKTWFSAQVKNQPTAAMLQQFVKEAKAAVNGKAKIIVAVNAAGTFAENATAYRGNIMDSEADAFAPKLFQMGSSYKINGKTVYTSNRAAFFQQAAAYYKTAYAGKTLMPFVELSSTSDTQVAALKQAGITNYILYQKNGSY